MKKFNKWLSKRDKSLYESVKNKPLSEVLGPAGANYQQQQPAMQAQQQPAMQAQQQPAMQAQKQPAMQAQKEISLFSDTPNNPNPRSHYKMNDFEVSYEKLFDRIKIINNYKRKAIIDDVKTPNSYKLWMMLDNGYNYRTLKSLESIMYHGTYLPQFPPKEEVINLLKEIMDLANLAKMEFRDDASIWMQINQIANNSDDLIQIISLGK